MHEFIPLTSLTSCVSDNGSIVVLHGIFQKETLMLRAQLRPSVSDTRRGLDRSNTGIVGSSLTRSMAVYPRFSMVCSPLKHRPCVGYDPPRSPTKCLNGFVVSEAFLNWNRL
jgi:hypothetical protein